MEEHAVPQNITNFEFKLFGPFTIHQFIYVAIGGIIGAVFYFSPLPKGIAYILGGIAVFGGIGFAAIPLQGRSLDKWIIAFFRSITHPTQRIWIKDNHIPYFLETSFLQTTPQPTTTQPLASPRLNHADLQTLLAKQRRTTNDNPFDQKESQFLSQILSLNSTVKATAAPPPQNQQANQSPFSPFQKPYRTSRPIIQATPKPAQLLVREQEIKAQELALAEKQKELEATKLKLEAEKQKKLELLTQKPTIQAHAIGNLEIQKRPEPSPASTPIIKFSDYPESLNPDREIKVLPYNPITAPAGSTAPQNPHTDHTATDQASKQRLAELDKVLLAQQKIEAEIKAKEEEIKHQQTKIQQEEEKFTQAWKDFEKTKSLIEGGVDTSTPDALSRHMLTNIGKKTTVAPMPSSNFSSLYSTQPIAAQIASDINFGGNVIAIPGIKVQFLQGIGDTRIRKLRSRPPDFSKATLPILGERQFDISKELKKRYEQPSESTAVKTAPATGISIEQIKKVGDFQPVRAGEIKEHESKNFTPPPSPNIHPKPEKQSKTQENVEHTPAQRPKHGQIVQPFNYQKETSNTAPKAEVKINLSEHSNTPNGIVYNSQGGLIQGALISVFDRDGVPVRAFKTNGLGQFVSVTPLPDGHYTIQTEFNGLNFDTIAFDAEGKLLDPFAITAKN